MNVLSVISNTPEWMAVRARHDTASEAPAAHGKSKYASRADLMKQKATSLTPEVDGAKQFLFNRGHDAEAAARSIAEGILESDLYPITATLTVDGINLLASLDGATMDEETIWEHKLFSEKLAADINAGTLDPHYTLQMDQQLLVSGAKRCLFMTSDGTPEKMAWCWYESSPEKFAALIAGWKQFRADLAAYVPPEVVQVAVATPTMNLPAVSVQMNGSIAVISNLDLFGAKLTEFVAALNKSPSDDQAFADTEAAIKTLRKAQDALEAAEAGALAQTASIEEMRRTVGLYVETARTTRLMLEKMVKARKEQIRIEIVRKGSDAYDAHIFALNQRIGRALLSSAYRNIPEPNFAGVINGKKTVTSLHDAVDTELARVKIAASALADMVQTNLDYLSEHAKDHAQLFPDTAQISFKAADDLQALVKSRITDHKAAEEKKEAEMRERIRAEEQAKAEKAAREQVEREQREAAAAELAAAKASSGAELSPAAQVLNEAEGAQRFAATHKKALQNIPEIIPASAAANVVPMRQPVDTGATMRLGQIGERLGFTLSAEFLRSLGFEPTGRERASVLYREIDFINICSALIRHIDKVREPLAA